MPFIVCSRLKGVRIELIFTKLLTFTRELVKRNIVLIARLSTFALVNNAYFYPILVLGALLVFFYMSKIIGFFLLPSNFLCCLAVLGLVLQKTRFAGIGRKLMGGAMIALVITAYSPLGNMLLLPLEDRFSQPNIEAAPYGIIVLGGSIDTLVSKARNSVTINEAAERLFEAVKLARRFPQARVLFTGGSGRIVYQGMSEADTVERFFADMGLSPDRLIFEGKAKNTWQNALFTEALIESNADQRWVLVTSAFHMPRSVGCFRKVGINIIPWPVDYRTRGQSDIYRILASAADGWKRLDVAVREWIGLLVYRIFGRTEHLFPSPHL